MAKDPEIIVSTGKMVGLFVALVVVCALFFGRDPGIADEASSGRWWFDRHPMVSQTRW